MSCGTDCGCCRKCGCYATCTCNQSLWFDETMDDIDSYSSMKIMAGAIGRIPGSCYINERSSSDYAYFYVAESANGAACAKVRGESVGAFE